MAAQKNVFEPQHLNLAALGHVVPTLLQNIGGDFPYSLSLNLRVRCI
jgi:hypothetical protein